MFWLGEGLRDGCFVVGGCDGYFGEWVGFYGVVDGDGVVGLGVGVDVSSC